MADRRIVDTTYLTVHPATAAWWQQREKCRQCAHLIEQAQTRNDQTSTLMLCARTMQKRANGSRDPRGGVSGYCIDARLDGGACGPGAAMFENVRAKGPATARAEGD